MVRPNPGLLVRGPAPATSMAERVVPYNTIAPTPATRRVSFVLGVNDSDELDAAARSLAFASSFRIRSTARLAAPPGESSPAAAPSMGPPATRGQQSNSDSRATAAFRADVVHLDKARGSIEQASKDPHQQRHGNAAAPKQKKQQQRRPSMLASAQVAELVDQIAGVQSYSDPWSELGLMKKVLRFYTTVPFYGLLPVNIFAGHFSRLNAQCISQLLT